MASEFEEKFADLLDTLEPKQRRAVVRSITNGILEGWEPTRADVELQVRARRERMSVDDIRREHDKIYAAGAHEPAAQSMHR